jgi:hypothetical protein
MQSFLARITYVRLPPESSRYFIIGALLAHPQPPPTFPLILQARHGWTVRTLSALVKLDGRCSSAMAYHGRRQGASLFETIWNGFEHRGRTPSMKAAPGAVGQMNRTGQRAPNAIAWSRRARGRNLDHGTASNSVGSDRFNEKSADAKNAPQTSALRRALQNWTEAT